VSSTWTDNDREFRALQRRTKALGRMSITIGVHGVGTDGLFDAQGKPAETQDVLDDKGGKAEIDMPQLAAIHEFGTATIPERSFVRAGIDNGRVEIGRAADRAIEGVLDGSAKRTGGAGGGMSAARAGAELVGMVAAGAIQDTIAKGIKPDLSDATKASRDRKAEHVKVDNGIAPGTYTPLRDSGQLIQSITYQVNEG
jgi:hypothetical protein